MVFRGVRDVCPGGCASRILHEHVSFGTRYRYVPKLEGAGWDVYVLVYRNGSRDWVLGNKFEVISK